MAVRPYYWTDSANRGASIISISWKSFWTHNSISGSLNPQQGCSSTLSVGGFSEPWGEHHQHQLAGTHNSISGSFNPQQGSSSTLALDGFSEPPGEHHQHQLEILLDSQLNLRVFQPAAGEQFDPIIGRMQRTTGRASSASAGNPFRLTTQSPGLSTHSRAAVRPNFCSPAQLTKWRRREFVEHWTESANRGASIISISSKSSWTHNSISGSFNPQQGSSSTLSVDGFSEPWGEHNQHQLEILLDSQLNLRVFQPTAG